MGSIEKRSRERVYKTKLRQTLLQVVKTTGFVSIAVLAPNVLGAMKKLGLIPKTRQREYVSSTASKLAKKGLLKFEGGKYCLTVEGEKVLRRWELTDFEIAKPKKWDKKWRMIIFDIPEKKRWARDRIRELMNASGLFRLQDSVWVYPYDCEDIIGLLKTEFGVGKDLLYVIADEIENDKHLRHQFKLPS